VLHLVTTPIDARIREAIAQKRLIEVRYKGRDRIIEPHDYGRLAGVDRLLIYQVESKVEAGANDVGWRLFDVPKIESLAVLDAPFSGSRAGALQSHHAWDALYARVE
jgi:hypothetical protein